MNYKEHLNYFIASINNDYTVVDGNNNKVIFKTEVYKRPQEFSKKTDYKIILYRNDIPVFSYISQQEYKIYKEVLMEYFVNLAVEGIIERLDLEKNKHQ